MTEPIRPAATEIDKEIFNHLLQKISAVDSYFCCGGTLELIDRPLSLYYKSESGVVSCLDFSSMLQQSTMDRQNAINNLFEACVPAPHGKGDETVLDESYRLARELRQNDFALSIDLTGEIGIGVLSSIGAMTAGRLILSKLEEDKAQEAVEDIKKEKGTHRSKHKITNRPVPSLTMIPQLYKLNAYAKDGFFKSHRDTPKGSKHIGTLMIALPVAHQGGALRVSHDGKEILFDWQEQCSTGVQMDSSQDGDSKLKLMLPWAFLFSDVEHEVLPVVSGTRVTIAYDIFASQEGLLMDMGPPHVNMAGSTIPLYEDFVAALRNPLFLVNGGKVAIALSHSYPMTRRSMSLTDKEFATGLKGVDAVVYRAMRAAGFDVHLRAVMQMVNDYRDDFSGIPEDGYGPFISKSQRKSKYLITSKTFKFANSGYYVDEDGLEYKTIVKKVFGARPDHQLMWAKKPKDTFINAGAYLAYSNEHSINFFYAAAAFILYVPPYGEGSRAFPPMDMDVQ